MRRSVGTAGYGEGVRDATVLYDADCALCTALARRLGSREGVSLAPIESPRGELACFVRSDGSSKPARVHMRDPSFVNLQAFKPMVQDLYIADLIAALAMLDPILGGIDR